MRPLMSPRDTGTQRTIPADLPGADLIQAGIDDLMAGRRTIPAMLVACAPARMTRIGLPLPVTAIEDPESALYDLVVLDVGERRAHGRYNALRRQLLSFLRAAGHAKSD